MLNNIIEAIIKIYADNNLLMHKVFDSLNLIDAKGELTINTVELIRTQSTVKDYEIKTVIAGQTLLSDDSKKTRFNQLLQQSTAVLDTINPSLLTSESKENVVGIVFNNVMLQDDEVSAVFNLEFTIYVCDLDI